MAPNLMDFRDHFEVRGGGKGRVEGKRERKMEGRKRDGKHPQINFWLWR